MGLAVVVKEVMDGGGDGGGSRHGSDSGGGGGCACGGGARSGGGLSDSRAPRELAVRVVQVVAVVVMVAMVFCFTAIIGLAPPSVRAGTRAPAPHAYHPPVRFKHLLLQGGRQLLL